MLREMSHAIPDEAHEFIDNAVVMVNWSELEPVDQQFTGPGWKAIDQAVATGMRLRLRIMAGIYSPDFVKALAGGPIEIVNGSQPDHRGEVPRFWEPQVLDQYEELMREVARRYEKVETLAEVVASGAMTVFAEPFYRAQKHGESNQRLRAAGLTFERDWAAHERVLRIHNELFPRTRTSLAINAWDVMTDDPAESYHKKSMSALVDFAQWARKMMGAKLVLQNNGLRSNSLPAPAGAADNLFTLFTKLPGPKGFQTATLARLGGSAANHAPLLEAANDAVKIGAQFIELPSGLQKMSRETVRELREIDARLEANAFKGLTP